jgi:hypothetical protein
MTKIYKNIVTNSLYEDLITPTDAVVSDSNINPITFYVDVQPSYFEIKCSYLKEVIGVNEDGSPAEPTYPEEIYFWHKIELADFIAKKSMCDNSLWTVRHDDFYSHSITSDTGVVGPITVNPLQIQDQFASTYLNKGNFFDKSNNQSAIYQIFVPYTEGANMTDFTYRINIDETPYTATGKTIPVVIDPSSPAKNAIQTGSAKPIDLISPITLTGPSTISADSTATITVETTPGVSFVYLDQVHGILPLVKVPLTNGTGSFKVVTLGMSAGDEVEIKAGFRKWNNVTAYTKTIS